MAIQKPLTRRKKFNLQLKKKPINFFFCFSPIKISVSVVVSVWLVQESDSPQTLWGLGLCPVLFLHSPYRTLSLPGTTVKAIIINTSILISALLPLPVPALFVIPSRARAFSPPRAEHCDNDAGSARCFDVWSHGNEQNMKFPLYNKFCHS